MNEKNTEFFIIEDDDAVAEVLRDIIEDYDLGKISGVSDGIGIRTDEIMALNPDVVLVDFLMPEKDGVQVVKELKAAGSTAKFIMISQVSSKPMIARAYEAGIDFFISKPINLIEVRTVIANINQQMKNERTIRNLKKMFLAEMGGIEMEEPAPKKQQEDRYEKRILYILSRLGMAGEKGSEDILRICTYLHGNGMSISKVKVSSLCERLSDSPKSMEQRVRRAIIVGMSNLAHMGVEDFMNETYTAYSGKLFAFEEIRAEMDMIRGKREYGGKASVKKFLDGLMLEAEAL
ncbi:MAG: DNA-binding domain-containing protein [Stomatobaculum sp.]|nr:DNA-binding domain-containing protein [Stomatobaculum sp.]